METSAAQAHGKTAMGIYTPTQDLSMPGGKINTNLIVRGNEFGQLQVLRIMVPKKL